jgi:hypothetical protein
VVGTGVVLLVLPATVEGQDGPIVNPDAVVDPRPSRAEQSDSTTGTDTTGTTDTTETDTTGTDTTGTDTTGTDTPEDDGVTAGGDEVVNTRSPAYGNAATRPPAAKHEEARGDCGERRPPNSRMLAIGGSVPRDEDGSFGWLALAVAAGAAGVALAAFLIRRRRHGKGEAAPGPLEVTGTLVAIFGGLAGLAVQFVPGVGVHEPPPTEATMAVREVHARITRGEYAKKTGADVRRIPQIDRREVGDVIWLEIGLKGYQDRRPRLQYALYDPDRSGTLLPATGETVDLRVEDSDAQTLVVPVWVGFPSSDHFQARFRLLDGAVVRQIAATGKLRTSPFRYACDEDI